MYIGKQFYIFVKSIYWSVSGQINIVNKYKLLYINALKVYEKLPLITYTFF